MDALLLTSNLVLEQGGGPPPESEEDSVADLQVVVHKIDLLSNLLIAYGTSNPELVNNWLERIKTFILTCSNRSASIRTSLYADLEKAFYFDNQYADIPIISDEQILVLQELRDITQEAILDVVKSGKTEKVNLIENRNDQWNTDVDDLVIIIFSQLLTLSRVIRYVDLRLWHYKPCQVTECTIF